MARTTRSSSRRTIAGVIASMDGDTYLRFQITIGRGDDVDALGMELDDGWVSTNGENREEAKMERNDEQEQRRRRQHEAKGMQTRQLKHGD